MSRCPRLFPHRLSRCPACPRLVRHRNGTNNYLYLQQLQPFLALSRRFLQKSLFLQQNGTNPVFAKFTRFSASSGLCHICPALCHKSAILSDSSLPPDSQRSWTNPPAIFCFEFCSGPMCPVKYCCINCTKSQGSSSSARVAGHSIESRV